MSNVSPWGTYFSQGSTSQDDVTVFTYVEWEEDRKGFPWIPENGHTDTKTLMTCDGDLSVIKVLLQ